MVGRWHVNPRRRCGGADADGGGLARQGLAHLAIGTLRTSPSVGRGRQRGFTRIRHNAVVTRRASRPHRIHRALAAASAAVLAVLVLAACVGARTPAPTTPVISYATTAAGVDPTSTALPSTAATTTPPAPSDGPLPVDDVMREASIGGAVTNGTWTGGCRTNPSVGLAGMSWHAASLSLSDGRTVHDLRIEMSVLSTANTGEPHVEHLRISGAFGDGDAFDAQWAPYYDGGDLKTASSNGVYDFDYNSEGLSALNTMRFSVYCS